MTLGVTRKKWRKWDYSRVATGLMPKKSLDSSSRLILRLNIIDATRCEPGWIA